MSVNIGKDEWRVKSVTVNGIKLEMPELTQISPAEKASSVSQPPHYTSGGIECIKYIKAKLEPEAYNGYLLGNIIKYISRAGKKGDTLEDLLKADQYLTWLIEEFEVEDENDVDIEYEEVYDNCSKCKYEDECDDECGSGCSSGCGSGCNCEDDDGCNDDDDDNDSDYENDAWESEILSFLKRVRSL